MAMAPPTLVVGKVLRDDAIDVRKVFETTANTRSVSAIANQH